MSEYRDRRAGCYGPSCQGGEPFPVSGAGRRIPQPKGVLSLLTKLPPTQAWDLNPKRRYSVRLQTPSQVDRGLPQFYPGQHACAESACAPQTNLGPFEQRSHQHCSQAATERTDNELGVHTKHALSARDHIRSAIFALNHFLLPTFWTLFLPYLNKSSCLYDLLALVLIGS